MTLLKRRIPTLLSDFFDEPFSTSVADWFGDRLWISRQPRVNIDEKNEQFDIEVAAPGMKKEDFHITCDNGLLTIKAEREEKKEEKQRNYTRREYNYNSFSRSFTLPENVKSEEVSAKYDNGILRVTVPKKVKGEAKAKKEIPVS